MNIVLFFAVLVFNLNTSICMAEDQWLDFSSPSPKYKVMLDENSVVCDEYNPPIYQLRGTAYYLYPDGSADNYYEVVCRYNYDKGEIWYRYPDGNWYLCYDAFIGRSIIVGFNTGMALFKIAYNMKFPIEKYTYHNPNWPNPPK